VYIYARIPINDDALIIGFLLLSWNNALDETGTVAEIITLFFAGFLLCSFLSLLCYLNAALSGSKGIRRSVHVGSEAFCVVQPNHESGRDNMETFQGIQHVPELCR